MRSISVNFALVAILFVGLTSCNDDRLIDDLNITGESLGEWDMASSAYPAWIEDIEAITFHNSRNDPDKDIQAFILFQGLSNFYCLYARDVYSLSYGGQTYIAFYDQMLGNNTKIRGCCDELTLFYTSDGRRVGNKKDLQEKFKKNSLLLWSNRIEYGDNAEKRVPDVYKIEGIERTDLIKKSILDLVEEARVSDEIIRDIEFYSLPTREGIIMGAYCLTNDKIHGVFRKIDSNGNVIDMSYDEYESIKSGLPFFKMTPEPIKGYY